MSRCSIKPLHRSFYEVKSKLNHFHGARSNRYNYLSLIITHHKSLKEYIYNLGHSQNTIIISLKNKMKRNKLVCLERAKENNGDFEQMRMREFMKVVYFKMWGKMSVYRGEKWQNVGINIDHWIVLGIMEGGDVVRNK